MECCGWVLPRSMKSFFVDRRHTMPRASDGPRAIQEPVYQSPIASDMKVGHQRHHVTTPCLFAASQQFHPPLGVVIVLAEDLL